MSRPQNLCHCGITVSSLFSRFSCPQGASESQDAARHAKAVLPLGYQHIGHAEPSKQHNQTHFPACSRKVAQKNGVYLNNKRAGTSQRRCHDCGKPTTDYRCPACWDKLRAGRDDYCANAYEDVL